MLDEVRSGIEELPDMAVLDLHVWSIGAGRRAAIIAVEPGSPQDLDVYRKALPDGHDLVHGTVEVCQRPTR